MLNKELLLIAGKPFVAMLRIENQTTVGIDVELISGGVYTVPRGGNRKIRCDSVALIRVPTRYYMESRNIEKWRLGEYKIIDPTKEAYLKVYP